jgi:hypothetical protein
MPAFYGVLEVMTHTLLSFPPHRRRRPRAADTFHPLKKQIQERLWTQKRS